MERKWAGSGEDHQGRRQKSGLGLCSASRTFHKCSGWQNYTQSLLLQYDLQPWLLTGARTQSPNQ